MYSPAPQYPPQPSGPYHGQPSGPYHGQPQAGYNQPPQYYNQPPQQYNQPFPDQPGNPAYNASPAHHASPYVADTYDNGIQDLGKGLAKDMRVQFLRKVLGILAIQFAFTAFGCSLVYINRYGAANFFRNNEALMGICFVGYIVCLYALGCYRSVARSVPTNYILLGIFTSCMTYMLAAMVVYYEPVIVLAASIITAGMVAALALYALTTKTDFTTCGAFLWCMFFVMALSIIFSFTFQNRAAEIAISGIGICIASLYIICDIQMIVGGRSHELSIDEYVFAAMILYVDIIRMFIYVLQLLGKK